MSYIYWVMFIGTRYLDYSASLTLRAALRSAGLGEGCAYLVQPTTPVSYQLRFITQAIPHGPESDGSSSSLTVSTGPSIRTKSAKKDIGLGS